MTAEAFEDLPIIQRRINAKDAPMPKTAAVTSIFDAGKKAKAKRISHTFAPDAISIKKGIPIPGAMTGKSKGDVNRILLERMQDGDMVEMSEQQSATLRKRASALGIRVAIRELANGKFGIWRVGLMAQGSPA